MLIRKHLYHPCVCWSCWLFYRDLLLEGTSSASPPPPQRRARLRAARPPRPKTRACSNRLLPHSPRNEEHRDPLSEWLPRFSFSEPVLLSSKRPQLTSLVLHGGAVLVAAPAAAPSSGMATLGAPGNRRLDGRTTRRTSEAKTRTPTRPGTSECPS